MHLVFPEARRLNKYEERIKAAIEYISRNETLLRLYNEHLRKHQQMEVISSTFASNSPVLWLLGESTFGEIKSNIISFFDEIPLHKPNSPMMGCRILWRHILAYTVCICPINRTPVFAKYLNCLLDLLAPINNILIIHVEIRNKNIILAY